MIPWTEDKRGQDPGMARGIPRKEDKRARTEDKRRRVEGEGRGLPRIEGNRDQRAEEATGLARTENKRCYWAVETRGLPRKDDKRGQETDKRLSHVGDEGAVLHGPIPVDAAVAADVRQHVPAAKHALAQE